MKKLEGDIQQMPPMVSAIKLNGVPLYKLARKGQEVERKTRLVHIYRYQLTEWAPPLVSFIVESTKGTYVRTLAHDVGQALGCGASLEALRRLKSSEFDVKDALTFDQVLALTPEELAPRVIPFARLLAR
jgi:tRNA pseudouridine55 synthase